MNSSEWIPEWLSNFPLESGIQQENSYQIICLFNEQKPKILYGKNNKYLPSIIRILIKAYKTRKYPVIFKESHDEIKTFFGKLKTDTKLLESIKIAKANSKGKILEKLNKYFP